LVKDVSSEIPTGFTLVAVVATGYKVDEMSGSRIGEPPLTLEPKVNGTNIEIRVWDAAGTEYGGSGWSGMKTHIEYTLFLKKSGPSGSSEIDKVIEDIAVVWDIVESKYLIPADYHVGDTGTLVHAKFTPTCS